jgi:hypothetical protein
MDNTICFIEHEYQGKWHIIWNCNKNHPDWFNTIWEAGRFIETHRKKLPDKIRIAEYKINSITQCSS